MFVNSVKMAVKNFSSLKRSEALKQSSAKQKQTSETAVFAKDKHFPPKITKNPVAFY